MVDPLNKTQAMSWLKRQLGCGVVVLELTDDHVDDAFDNAVRWWISKKGIQRNAVCSISSSISEYSMPDDCDEVIDVSFPGIQLDAIAAVNPYVFIDVDQLPVAYQALTGIPQTQFYSTYQQVIQHAETARRIVGAEFSWDYDKNTNYLRIYPDQHKSGTAIARYLSTTLVSDDPVSPATTPINDFSNLRFRDRDIILRYAKSELKEMLGLIRGKFSEMPGAGGKVTLDGDTLRTEASSEKIDLNNELIGLSDPVPFLVG
jgi:hypothetical protein